MKSMISGLFLSTLCLALAGCALTEVVTPPPPATHTLPPQAQALLDQPIPQCMAPVTRTQAAINKQNKLLKAQQAQLEALRQAELARWERRQAYLEDELEFYKKEVRRTGGSWELTKTTDKPVPFKLSTTGNFTEQIKKQQEREYNERQYRRFYRAIKRGEAKHERLLGLYQERQQALEQAFAGCANLSVALKKAKEDEALHRNTRAVKGFGQHDVQVVEVLPNSGVLEPVVEEALEHSLETAQETAPLDEPAQPLSPAVEADEDEFLEEYAETMEELLRDTLQEPAPLLAQP